MFEHLGKHARIDVFRTVKQSTVAMVILKHSYSFWEYFLDTQTTIFMYLNYIWGSFINWNTASDYRWCLIIGVSL